MFLLVPANPGCPGSKAVKRSLLLLLFGVFNSELAELRHIIGEELISKLVESSGEESDRLAVRACFTTLMMCPDDVVQKQLNKLTERLQCNCRYL